MSGPPPSGVPPDHFARLGVPPGAPAPVVRRAYRELAWRLHPDRSPGATPAERALADRRMKEINASWAVLSDPEERRRYELGRRERSASDDLSDLGRRQGPELDPFSGPGTFADPVPHHRWNPLLRWTPWVVLALVALIVALSPYLGTVAEPLPGPPECALENRLVDCADPHDAELVSRPSADRSCPQGTLLLELSEPWCVRMSNG